MVIHNNKKEEREARDREEHSMSTGLGLFNEFNLILWSEVIWEFFFF